MAEITRGPAAADWWLDEPEPQVRDNYTEDDGLLALEYLAEALETMTSAVSETDTMLADAARYMTEHLNVQDLVATVAMVQDLKRRLGVAEAYLARQVGLATAEYQSERTGTLPDGRPYEVLKSATRRAWDHQGWQADVRQVIMADVMAADVRLLNRDTGEIIAVDLASLLEIAQAVHGSTAPRTKALKDLGLDPGDYCESTPGPWSVKISQPTTPTA